MSNTNVHSHEEIINAGHKVLANNNSLLVPNADLEFYASALDAKHGLSDELYITAPGYAAWVSGGQDLDCQLCDLIEEAQVSDGLAAKFEDLLDKSNDSEPKLRELVEEFLSDTTLTVVY